MRAKLIQSNEVWPPACRSAGVDWPGQCGVVIPCLNEAAAIGQLVVSVRRSFDTVLVVDDGSSDRTSDLARAQGAEVLRHDRQRGKGAALRTGLQWLEERRFRWALLMDGDGQHAVEDIPLFLECANRTGASMVVGNRMSSAAAMPWLRREVNRWMSRRLSILTGRSLPDSQCGFRLLNIPVWSALNLSSVDHFEVESELLFVFILAGEPVEFVPIRVIYAQERTKVCPVLDAWRWCRWWLRAIQIKKAQPARPLPTAAPGTVF